MSLNKSRAIGAMLITMSLILLFTKPITNLTGFATSTSSDSISISAIYVVAIISLIAGLMLIKSITLDAIIIPSDPRGNIAEKRARRAAREFRKTHARKIMVTGGPTPYMNKKYRNEAQITYNALRKCGIKPKDMKVETKSQNTVEQVLYSLDKINGTRIGVVSNASQLDRIEEIVEKGKQEGEIDSKVEIYRIETKASPGERMFEPFAKYGTKKQLKKGIREGAKHDEGTMFLKSILVYITGLFSK